MKIKNTSKGDFNLKSGKLCPGKIGEANYDECQVLFSSKLAEVVTERPVVKKKAVVKNDG